MPWKNGHLIYESLVGKLDRLVDLNPAIFCAKVADFGIRRGSVIERQTQPQAEEKHSDRRANGESSYGQHLLIPLEIRALLLTSFSPEQYVDQRVVEIQRTPFAW
jgi:hypothetical protein